MTPTAATWIRQHAWTHPVRAEAKHSHTILSAACLCQQPFTSAACTGGSCRNCEATPTWTAESILIGPHGRTADLSRPKPSDGQNRWVLLWLADRTCTHRCGHACHGQAPAPTAVVAVVPVQLNLFAEMAL